MGKPRVSLLLSLNTYNEGTESAEVVTSDLYGSENGRVVTIGVLQSSSLLPIVHFVCEYVDCVFLYTIVFWIMRIKIKDTYMYINMFHYLRNHKTRNCGRVFK